LVNKRGLIAVVDDELDIAQLFRDALQSTNGFTIFAFTKPQTAFEHF
jgi:DNA-binding response OmpR family regulator